MALSRIPTSQAVLGLTLFATIALPMTRSGQSLLDILMTMARQHPMDALTFLLMFGSPQLFGLAVAVAGLVRDEQRAIRLVQLPLVIVQCMVALAGLLFALAPRVIAPFAIAGFAIITSLYFVYASAEASASSRGDLSLHWYIRWGALLIAGLGLWLRLQSIHGLYLGPALDVAAASAVLLLASTARRRPVLA